MAFQYTVYSMLYTVYIIRHYIVLPIPTYQCTSDPVLVLTGTSLLQCIILLGLPVLLHDGL